MSNKLQFVVITEHGKLKFTGRFLAIGQCRMICFDKEQYRFNYRIIGIAIHDDRVLLHQAEGDTFGTFPGGRAELGEPTEETIKREMREELDVDVEVVRLLWVVENFFPYDGKDYHELAFYFLMRLPAHCPYLYQDSFESMDGETNLTFQWFPQQPEILSRLPLLPSFLQTAIQHLPGTVQHIVHIENAKA